MPLRQRSRPAALRSQGKPAWLSTTGMSGMPATTFAAASSSQVFTRRSHDRPYFLSRRRPPSHFGSRIIASSAGLERMPRTRGNALCCSRILSVSPVWNQAWATIAFGMSCCRFISVSQRVSATCWSRLHSASTCTVFTTSCCDRVAPVIRRQVVALQRAVVAEKELVRLLVLQPGVVQRAAGELPEMMMGIDDLHRHGPRRAAWRSRQSRPNAVGACAGARSCTSPRPRRRAIRRLP